MDKKQTATRQTVYTVSWPLDPRHFRHHLDLWLPSTLESIESAAHHVRRMAEKCGCLEDPLIALEIAVREALANAIIHAHKRQSSKKVFLGCYGDPEAGVLIVVRDQGDGFDPDAVPDPRAADRVHREHGRGLMLMRKLMDYMSYRNGGRELILYKTCCPG